MSRMIDCKIFSFSYGNWLLLASLYLTACVGGQRAPERAQYDFALSSKSTASREIDNPLPLRIEVQLPAWQDSGDIFYRLNYEEPSRLRTYTMSRWVARPSQLLAAHLKIHLLSARPAICSVRVEVDEFAQHFAKQDKSEQLLNARWTLFNPKAQVLYAETLYLKQTSLSHDAKGSVLASAQLIELLASHIKTKSEQYVGPCVVKD